MSGMLAPAQPDLNFNAYPCRTIQVGALAVVWPPGTKVTAQLEPSSVK